MYVEGEVFAGESFHSRSGQVQGDIRESSQCRNYLK